MLLLQVRRLTDLFVFFSVKYPKNQFLFVLARLVFLVGNNPGESNNESLAYEVEPRPVSRGELGEVRAAARSYRVELVMRMAPPPHPEPPRRSSSSQACVVVRLARKLGTNKTTAGATDASKENVGVACVTSSSWQRVVVKAKGGEAAVLLRLATAHTHRVLLQGMSTATVHVDQLRLVQMSEEH